MSERNANTNRLQQSVPAACIVALAVWVAFISFNVEDPEPYLFPRLVSVGLVFLASLALYQAVSGKALTGSGLSFGIVRTIIPALIVMAAFVFLALEFLGMYAASALAFFLIVVFYDPAPHDELRSWVKRVIVTSGFMALMYGLFAMLLKVQTPRGLFL